VKICVIIPVYNEAVSISGLIDKIKQQCLEIVVIDDGSKDNTYNIVRNKEIPVIKNSVNMGKGTSLVKGFEYAINNGFDAVITMDGDGQHDPADIPYFIRLATYSDNAVFIGNRMGKPKNMPRLRFFTNKFMSWVISSMIKQHIPDTQCGFRLVKKDALQKIQLETAKFEAESEFLIKLARQGFKIESIPINTIYTGNNKSKINPFTDTIRFIKFISKEVRF